MKRDGFTLVEVITVIVILGVIVLIAVPSYFGVTGSLKQREYNNKVKQIEIKATEWATDNNISDDTTITISKLVDEGYVNMDDETSIDKRVINPLNKESMECYHVEISVNNGRYKAVVKESTDCVLKSLEEQDKNIKVVGYEIDSNTNTILSNKALELKGNELPWSGKDILLVTTSDIYKDPKSITYSSGSTSETKSGMMYSGTFKQGDQVNLLAYQNLYVVSANVILKSKYNIIYETETEKPRKQILVKIDKENPNGSYSMLEKWGTSANKKVLLSGSDGAGSGVKGFYINSTNNITGATYYEANKNEREVSLSMGVYYFWIEDNVGNKSATGERLEVTNIDDTPPECVYRGMNGSWTNQPVTITWGCSDNESGCTTPKQSRTFDNGIVTSFTIPKYTVSDAAGNKIECGGNTVDVKFDNVKPTCTTGKTHQDTPDGVTINVNCSDDGSGIKDNPSGDHGGQKSTQTYTVTDHAGNSNSYTVEVSNYQMYYHQDANTCRNLSFGCDEWPSCDIPTTWNDCKTGANTCSYGCGSSKTLVPSYAICVAECSGSCVSENGNTYCVKSTGCSNCYYGSNTCQGGWNTEYRADPYCGACVTATEGTGGAECGWHDAGWQRNSCSGNLCQVTAEQTWYT